MVTRAELHKPEELLFNPGEIVIVDGWPRWQTTVGPFELQLDIVAIGQPESEAPEIGIASFVVMEQEQPFLDYVGSLLARAISDRTADREILLMTVESKGCHFVPRVWDSLAQIVGSRLNDRIITLRKGEPKVYMLRPVVVNGQEISLPQASFFSITSANEQNLIISPKDIELLYLAVSRGILPVFVDDFIGRGGTLVAIYRLFEQLNQQLVSKGLSAVKPPRLAAVLGSDGSLFEQTFVQEGIDLTLLPQPFPLKLPTFVRENEFEPWQIDK